MVNQMIYVPRQWKEILARVDCLKTDAQRKVVCLLETRMTYDIHLAMGYRCVHVCACVYVCHVDVMVLSSIHAYGTVDEVSVPLNRFLEV